MLTTKVMSKKHTILGGVKYYDLLEVLYILRNEDNTFLGMNNKFLGVLSLILRYYLAQNKGYVKKTDNP